MTTHPVHMLDLEVKGEALDLTGRIVENVKFIDCTLELRQDQRVRTYMKDALFIDCAYTGDGWQWLEMDPVSV